MLLENVILQSTAPQSRHSLHVNPNYAKKICYEINYNGIGEFSGFHRHVA